MDVLGRPVAELPVGQVSLILDEIRPTPAGTAGGTAVDLARLGARVVAIGAIGTDLAGDFVVNSLASQGVDPSSLRRKDGVQTSCTMLPIHPDGSRPAWHVPGANSTFEIGDVDWAAVDRAAAVHLGGLTALPAIDGEPAGRLLARARDAGALTTADFLGVRGRTSHRCSRPCFPTSTSSCPTRARRWPSRATRTASPPRVGSGISVLAA